MTPGTVLFAAPDDDLGLSEARDYIARYNLTKDDVKLVKRSGMVIVECIREVKLEGN